MSMDFIARALAISVANNGGSGNPGYSKIEIDAKINNLSNEINEINDKVEQVDDNLSTNDTFIDDVTTEVLTNISEEGVLLDGGSAAN